MRDPLQDDDVEVGVETPVLVQQGEADGVTEAGRIVQFHKIGSSDEPDCSSQENRNSTKNIGCSKK